LLVNTLWGAIYHVLQLLVVFNFLEEALGSWTVSYAAQQKYSGYFSHLEKSWFHFAPVDGFAEALVWLTYGLHRVS